MDIEQLRAAMRSIPLTGRGTFLPNGTHELKIEKFFFKGPGEKSPMGLFITEFKALKSSSQELDLTMTYSETFDPTKSGWESRLKKFILAALGVDWRGKLTDEQHDLAADIRFSAQFESERVKLTKKYDMAPEQFLLGRTVRAETAPYLTKGKVQIAASQWFPAPQ